MGAFWAGWTKARSHAHRKEAALLFSEIKAVSEEAAGGGLDDTKDGLRRFLESAVVLRTAASTAIGFFAVHRASEIARLVAGYVSVDRKKGVVGTRVVRQKNDQLGVGQIAFLVTVPAWGQACTLKVMPEWLWLRQWSKKNRHRDGH